MSKMEMPESEELKTPEPEVNFKDIIEEDPLGKLEGKRDRDTANSLSLRVAEEINAITGRDEKIEQKPGFIKRTKGLVIATLLAGALAGPLGGAAEAQTGRRGDRRTQAIIGEVTGHRKQREDSVGKTIAKEVIKAGAGIYAQKEAIELANIIKELRMVDQRIAQLENELRRIQHQAGNKQSGINSDYQNIADVLYGKKKDQNQNKAEDPNLSEADKIALEVQDIMADLDALYANREELIKAAKSAELRGEIATDIYYAVSGYRYRR